MPGCARVRQIVTPKCRIALARNCAKLSGYCMISCSTCWNSGRHTDGAAMIQEILDLGFDTVELGHGIRLSLVEGILKMVEAGKVKVSSLHNFCPLPPEIPRASDRKSVV